MKQPVALIILTAMDNKRDIKVVNLLQNILSNVNDELESHQKSTITYLRGHLDYRKSFTDPNMKIKINIIEKNTMDSPLKNFQLL